MKIFIYTIYLLSFSLLIVSCGTSTASRYERSEDEKRKDEIVKSDIKEDFDMTPYRTQLSIEKPADITFATPSDVWTEYTETVKTADPENRRITGTSHGFRVELLTTDDLDEANQLRSDIYFRTSHRDVYVIFEPPFYRVKIGDYTERNIAEDVSFKMKQLGYQNARVVSDEINIYE